jgi:hypothetical protein
MLESFHASVGRVSVATGMANSPSLKLQGTNGKLHAINLFLEKAYPESDFKYDSKSSAFFFVPNAPHHTKRHGRYFLVYEDAPSL